MKPRLRLEHGVWSCATFLPIEDGAEFYVWRVGYGYTAIEAYDDWMVQP